MKDKRGLMGEGSVAQSVPSTGMQISKAASAPGKASLSLSCKGCFDHFASDQLLFLISLHSYPHPPSTDVDSPSGAGDDSALCPQSPSVLGTEQAQQMEYWEKLVSAVVTEVPLKDSLTCCQKGIMSRQREEAPESRQEGMRW